MNIWLILAQAKNAPAEKQGPGGGLQFLVLLGVMIVVFYLIVMRPQRKQQAHHRRMLDALKKGDRVMTIGGILGSVIDVGDKEVLLKIDEGTNTKVKFTRAAIRKVLTDEETPQ